MTTTLTGNGAVYDNTVAAPADGDVANGTLFQAGLQRVLNNARWLYEKVTTVGVDAVRSVADTAALKAITGMSTGATAIVRGQGIYVYADPDATAEALPFVIAPTVGTGRWRSAPQPNRIVAAYQSGAVAAYTATAAFANVPGLSVTVPGCLAGDRIDATWSVEVWFGAATQFGYLRAAITDPVSGDISLCEPTVGGHSTLMDHFTYRSIFTVTNPGTHIVKAMFSLDDAAMSGHIGPSTAPQLEPASVSAIHIRP